MPPKIDLEPYKANILIWLGDNLSYEAISSKIYNLWGIKCTSRTLRRQFAQWNISRYIKRGSLQAEHIKSRISTFFLDNYNDLMILQALFTEGIEISRRQLARYRIELGLTRRMSIAERERRFQELKAAVREELDKGGIEGYGEGLVKSHFRGLGITAPRRMIYQIIKELDEEGYKRRAHDFQRGKKEYIVKGPDWQWAIDQHDKLSKWGFEIYAAIDAYSRKVIWVYVGISNRTGYSVLGQFLKVLREKGYHPRIVTSDKGGEVPFLAEV
jgi:hypothetical protein